MACSGCKTNHRRFFHFTSSFFNSFSLVSLKCRDEIEPASTPFRLLTSCATENLRAIEAAMDCSMYKAAREGNVEFQKQFIQSDNNLFLHTHQENNIVHIAAKLGHDTFVHEALRASPFLASHKNSKGDTPLHVAARAGHVDVVKLLLSGKGSSLFRVDPIETPNTTVLREMEEGESGLPKLWRMRNKVQSTALHEALRNGHEQVALCLWELDHEMAGLVNCAGESPLYLAAESRCREVLLKILKFLTQESDNPNLLREAIRGPDGQNPLHAAILSGSSECISCLLRLEETLELIDQPDTNGMTALHFATAARETKIICQLLNESTSSAYVRDTYGRTPLLEAASSGNFYVLQEILQHCPETIELCDPAGRNALHLAVLNNTVNNVRDFLCLPEMRELVNEPDEEGNTPLHLAIKNQNYKMVRKLMATRCVDLRTKNNSGLTALDICESDWKLSYRQKSLYSYLNGHHAPRGRLPYNWKLHPKRKSAFNQPGADLKQMANTLSVVAALLATLTFAAAFTLPGGYYSDNGNQEKNNNDDQGNEIGNSILIVKASLKAFVLADSLAVCCSMTVVFLLVLAMVGDPSFLRSAIIYSKNLLYVALGGTLVAFMTGLYTVIYPESQWVATVVIIMGSSVPFLIKYLCRKSSISTPLVMQLIKGSMKQPFTRSTPGKTSERLASRSSVSIESMSTPESLKTD